MDNGFTGFDYGKVRGELDSIYGILKGTMFDIYNNIDEFFKDLRRNWASPNAVQFSKDTAVLVEAYLKNIGTCGDRIINDIDASVLTYVKSTGIEENFSSFGSGLKYFTDNYNVMYTMDQVNHNGQTGMNIRLVEDLLTNKLSTIKTNALSKLDSLPNSISFFDIIGEQQSAYFSRKQSIKDLIEELLTEIESQIRSYIETEKNNILLAKQQVVQNMNGSNTTNA